MIANGANRRMVLTTAEISLNALQSLASKASMAEARGAQPIGYCLA
jgi:hypothetical protein